MCTIALAKVQRNYNCYNVYFYECLLITMKRETWKTVIQVIISILTAAATAMGTTACMR